jgi:hypothetical protein
MRLSLLAPLILIAACEAAPEQQPEFCDCAPATTDEMSVEQTGFPNALIYAQDGYSAPKPDGTTDLYVQFDADKATPAQIAASPGALCRAADLTLVSSRVVPPGPDDMDIEGSMIVRAICK